MSIFKYRKDHPYRAVNWRWERARILKEYGKSAPGRKADDKWVRVAAAFRAAKDRCKDEADLYKLFERWPDLAMAYELWDEENVITGMVNPMRYEIEARILARESFATISKRCGLPANSLHYYERLFFNVTDRIDNKMYIFHVAIGDKLQRGMTDRDYAILWKIYGYVRGSHMLDFLITTFSDWAKPGASQVEGMLLEDHKSNMRRKAALASRMSGVNHHTADRLIELHTKIMEIEKAAGEGETGGVHNNIQVMLNHLPLLVGTETGNIANDPIRAYHSLTADLRANEMLALSAGQHVVDPESLAEFKFPEPETNGKEANKDS